MRPIQTVYKGYHFRSRLEARWAVFFDTLSISYAYEREGYRLAGQWYLPDFWLPEQQCWIEIKGDMPTAEEHEKAQLLATLSKKPTFIFSGEIQIPYIDGKSSGSRAFAYPTKSDLASLLSNLLPQPHAWVECPYCGQLDITLDGKITQLSCSCFFSHFPGYDPIAILHPYPEEGSSEEKRLVWWYEKLDRLLYGHDSPSLINAYKLARSARFEHGEAH